MRASFFKTHFSFILNFFEQWLRDSFFRKEKLLQKFYEDQTKESLTENWPRKLVIKSNGKHPIMSVSVWILVVFSCLYFYSWFRWFVVVMIITCIAVRTFNGFDSVELALHGDMVFRDALTSEAEKKEKKIN
jgi:hypothetical protein